MIFHCKLYKRTRNGLKEIGSKTARATLTDFGLRLEVSYPNAGSVDHELVHAIARTPGGPWQFLNAGRHVISRWTSTINVIQDIGINL